ncbi:hypothetical protein GGD38_007607 [Chitinophagaceae bacterium OAS944]|nr:hypothetical protein [Chitinophagaceae bacterium OAS944]
MSLVNRNLENLKKNELFYAFPQKTFHLMKIIYKFRVQITFVAYNPVLYSISTQQHSL